MAWVADGLLVLLGVHRTVAANGGGFDSRRDRQEQLSVGQKVRQQALNLR